MLSKHYPLLLKRKKNVAVHFLNFRKNSKLKTIKKKNTPWCWHNIEYDGSCSPHLGSRSGLRRHADGLCELEVKVKSEKWLLAGSVGLVQQKGKNTRRAGLGGSTGRRWLSFPFLLVGSSPGTPPWVEREDGPYCRAPKHFIF